MSMYTVLLIDDEPWALLGLENSVDWGENGFIVIGKTTSPDEAIEIIRNDKPDLVITDIRMPQLSGLDLIRISREEALRSKFIIVSGYSDFAYAQQAIKYNVIDYVLKPLNKTSAQAAVRKAIDVLSDEDNVILNVSEVNVINKLNNKEIIGELKAEMKDDTSFYCLILDQNSEESFLRQMRMNQTRYNRVFTVNDKAIYVVIVDTMVSESLFTSLRSFVSNKGFNVGVSEKCNGIDKILHALKQAHISYYNKFFYQKNDIYVYEKPHKEMSRVILSNVSDSIFSGNKGIIDRAMTDMINEVKNRCLSIKEFTWIYNHLLMLCGRKLFNDIASIDLVNYETLYKGYLNIEACIIGLKEIILLNLDSYQPEGDGSNKQFSEMLKYIDSNFNKRINLDQLSEKFFLNKTYICDLFKKNKKQSLSAYISGKRLEYSCELLKETELSAKEIANKAGYDSYSYFSTIFKRNYGVSPNEYRKMQ